MKNAKRPNRCIVLENTPLAKNLWEFSADGSRPKLEGKTTTSADKPVPPKIGRKSWLDLFQPRLNVAWLPADQVFIRVVQLPQADAAEIGSMLEFQLEKISPLPVAQIVWSFELVQSREINNTTALVIIAARDLVEERIGVIEQSGYQPDRLELPHVYQIVAELPEGDGVWLYPWSEGGKEFCIAAWWFTGTMRNLQLIHLPSAGDRSKLLEEQLMKTAWAGEMEGWLNFPVKWRVVAMAEAAAEWQKLLEGWSGGAIQAGEQMPVDRLAQFTAARALKGEPAANLLPPEFAVRYRQQFVDRLWMRGLLAVVSVYLVVVFAYFLAVQWVRFKSRGVNQRVANVAQSYTNTLRLKERVQVLQDQQALKYAALDCWKAASDLLPPELTIKNLSFSRGQTVDIRGVAENAKALADYNDALRSYTVGGQRLFQSVSPPTSSTVAGGTTLSWAFTCELNRQEVQ